MSHIVDTHTHYFAPGFLEELGVGPVMKVEPAGRNIVATYRGVPAVGYRDGFDFERQLEVNEAAGVTNRILSTPMNLAIFSEETDIPSLDLARRMNDRTAAAAARAPDRLWAMGTLCPLDAAHIAEGQRCRDELGFKGFIIDTSWHGRFLDGEDAFPFWEWVEGDGVPVFLHPPRLPIGYEQQMNQYKQEEAVGRPFDTAMCLARMIMGGVFDRFPRLRVAVAHMGGGLLPVMGRLDMGVRLGYEGMPEDAVVKCEKLPSEYLRDHILVDSMGFWGPQLRQAIECLGVDNVMFGTDYGPVPLDPREHIEIVRGLGLSQEDEEKVFWRTADAFYGLGLS